MMQSLLVLFLLLFNASFAQTQALSELVYQIRNPKTQAAPFRQALEKIGEYLALNVLEELKTKTASIHTLTDAEAVHTLIDESPVLVTILRAGLPLNAGIQKVFPDSEVGFLAMSRNEETLKASLDYVALPELTNRSVILSDTMLATGGSLSDAIQVLLQRAPKKIYVISAIASQAGIDRLQKSYPDIQIFTAAIDPSLNHKGYIVPGLGDAGDRAYGLKSIKIKSNL